MKFIVNIVHKYYKIYKNTFCHILIIILKILLLLLIDLLGLGWKMKRITPKGHFHKINKIS